MNRQTDGVKAMDRLSMEDIITELKKSDISLKIEIKESVDSTNGILRTYAEAGEKQDMLLLAEHQSGGRGRKGRSFYSPEGTGLYMSLLLHPGVSAGEVHMLTPLAAVAAAKALEQFAEGEVQIKWVNDILVRGRKTVGILTETSGTLTEGRFDYVIVGIGINVYEPEGGFPEEIRESAGAIFSVGEVRGNVPGEVRVQMNSCDNISGELQKQGNMRSRIAAEVVRQFMDLYESFPEKRYLEEYRRYSCLIGKEIRVIPTEQITGSVEEAERAASPIFGKVLSIDENCRLMVAYEDGSCELLSSGEVSVRER